MTLIQLQDTRPWMLLGAGQQWAKWKVILIVIWIATQQRVNGARQVVGRACFGHVRE